MMKIKTLKDVKNYWDNNPTRGIWNSYDSEINHIYRKENYFFDIIHKFNIKRKKVLDIGCGRGTLTYYLLKNGADVKGIDISDECIKIADDLFKKEKLPKICHVGNAEKLEFNDNKFDIIFSFGVLHHTPHIKKSAQEIHRVLKKNGKIGVMLYRKYSLQFIIHRLLRFLNYKNILYNLVIPKKEKVYSPLIRELFLCPIANSYTSSNIKKIFNMFDNFKFEYSHTGLTRINDFIKLPKLIELFLFKLDSLIKPIFGVYIIFYAEK